MIFPLFASGSTVAAISRNQCACKQREEFSRRQLIRLGIRITAGQRSEMDFHSRFLASVGLSTLHRLLCTCTWAHISQTIECSTVRGPWIQVLRKRVEAGIAFKTGNRGNLAFFCSTDLAIDSIAQLPPRTITGGTTGGDATQA